MSDDLKIRLTGAFLAGAGTAMGWWLILGPYRQALAGAPEVEVHFKAFFIVPIMLIFGLAFLGFGARLPLRGADRDRQRRAGFLIFGVVAVIAGVTWWLLKSQFAALGYA